MYIRRTGNRKGAEYARELAVVEALRKRLDAGDGWTRITMKADSMKLDICVAVDGKYHVTFPPHYDAAARNAPYKMLNEWFDGLDDVAEFVLNNGWMRRYR